MKTVLRILPFLLLLTACNSSSKPKVQKTGIVKVLNGKGVADTVRYNCETCPGLLSNMDVFGAVIAEASKTAKNSLRNPLSFKARNIDMTVLKEDSLHYLDGKKVDSCYGVFINYRSIGQNAYGTEGEVDGQQYIYLVNNVVTDLTGKLKKPALGLNDGVVNRDLDLFDDDKSLSLMPTKTVRGQSLIVNSSISCVDEGDALSIEFENGDEIKVRSWNDFNCDSKSYFDLSNAVMQKLATLPLKYVSFYHKGESIFCSVPANDKDYMMQYAKLYSK